MTVSVGEHVHVGTSCLRSVVIDETGGHGSGHCCSIAIAHAVDIAIGRGVVPVGRATTIGLLVLAVFDFVQVVNGTGIASTRHSVFAHRGQDHALAKTLLEATVLAPVALLLGDLALAVGNASVHSLVLYCSLEEPFAPFASDDAVVQSSGPVLADHANHGLIVGRHGLHGLTG